MKAFNPQESPANSQPTSGSPAAVAKKAWHYFHLTDKMTGDVTEFACLDSEDKLQFAFPYDGGSTGTICFTKWAEGKDNEYKAYFDIDKGQILCSQSCSVFMKLDDGKPLFVSATPDSNGSSKSISLNSSYFFGPKSNRASLREAKVLMLQVEYYQEGRQVLTFEPDKPLDPSW